MVYYFLQTVLTLKILQIKIEKKLHGRARLQTVLNYYKCCSVVVYTSLLYSVLVFKVQNVTVKNLFNLIVNISTYTIIIKRKL